MPQEKLRNHKLRAVPTPAGLGEGDEVLDLEECPMCFGSGMEIVPDKGARICVCRKLKSQVGKFERVRLPRRYDGFHFTNYRPQNTSHKEALKLAMTLTMDFPAVDRGLLLMGTVGVGKTHLAVSILKGLTERGFNCLFYEFGSLLKEIQDSYNPFCARWFRTALLRHFSKRALSSAVGTMAGQVIMESASKRTRAVTG